MATKDNVDASAQPRRESLAELTRTIAARLESLTKAIHQSFAHGRPAADRTRIVNGIVTAIWVDALPVISWMERRQHPRISDLNKNRMEYILSQAIACAQQDIPEYATGRPRAIPGQARSPGCLMTAALRVTCSCFAAYLCDLAADMEFEDRQRALCPRQGVRVAAESSDIPPEYVPADTLAYDYGISHSRLSEGARARRIRTMPAPPGMMSNGRRVRKLYHRGDALRHASPKYLQERTRKNAFKTRNPGPA